eukprot:sb/3467315/
MSTMFDTFKGSFARLRDYALVPAIALRGSLVLWSTLICPLFRPEEVGEVGELFVHPIRALQPVQVTPGNSWLLTSTGFWLDKRMCMLHNNERLKHTTKGWEALYGVGVSLTEDTVVLSHASKPDLVIPLSVLDGEGEALKCSKGNSYRTVPGVGDWLTEVVGGRQITLVYSPEGAVVPGLDPVLIIGQNSLSAFEETAGHTMEMERFRPNIVAVEKQPFADEGWAEVKVGEAVLVFCHRCTRCSITNVSPEGIRTDYTMDSLREKRPRCEKTNKPVFGSYFKVKCPGLVKPGDKIMLIKSQ